MIQTACQNTTVGFKNTQEKKLPSFLRAPYVHFHPKSRPLSVETVCAERKVEKGMESEETIWFNTSGLVNV